jgi:aerobic carbon-monoxide dehydrogenase medium subunit
MIPNSFEYFAPKSVQEAVGLLDQYQEDAKVLAGGHSLLPQMKLRLSSPRYVVDIGRIPDLAYIKEENGRISIGALTTHYTLESSSLLKQKCPLICETAAAIGDVQVRNRGTIGGSLAHNDPAADWPATMMALDAELKLIGKSGERIVKVGDFLLDMLTTVLQPAELLVEIRLSAHPTRTGSTYLKMHQRASGFAIVGVAARVSIDGSRVCQDVGIGITGVGSKAYRARQVEGELQGKTLDAAAIKKASQKASDGVEALADLHASSEYRSHVAQVFTGRALETALSRAQ